MWIEPLTEGACIRSSPCASTLQHHLLTLFGAEREDAYMPRRAVEIVRQILDGLYVHAHSSLKSQLSACSASVTRNGRAMVRLSSTVSGLPVCVFME